MSQNPSNRRALLAGAGATTSALLLAGAGSRTWSQPRPAPVGPPPPPRPGASRKWSSIATPSFRPSSKGPGSIGPWGEVQLRNSDLGAAPVLVQSADRAGVLDLTGRRGFLSLGGGALTATSAGVSFTKGAKPEPWSKATIKRLIETIAQRPDYRRSATQLRSALLSSYVDAARPGKAKAEPRIAKAILAGSKAVGSSALTTTCTSQSVTETVLTTVEKAVKVMATAEEQYDKCVSDGYRANGIPGVIEAACFAKGFIDVVVGWITVVVEVVQEVTRVVVTCVTSLASSVIPGLPSLWNGDNLPLRPFGKDEKGPELSMEVIRAALAELKTLLGFAPAFVQCLLDADWSLASLKTSYRIGGSQVVVPYGVKVCLSADCARQLSIMNVAGLFGTSGAAIAAALAAVSPEAAAALAPFGITATPAVAAAVAAASPAIVQAMLIILLMIIVLLFHAVMVSGQLALWEFFNPDSFADGKVCIEHPSMALAVLNLVTLGMSSGPAALVPPIVTG